jgi:hypothetical protein
MHSKASLVLRRISSLPASEKYAISLISITLPYKEGKRRRISRQERETYELKMVVRSGLRFRTLLGCPLAESIVDLCGGLRTRQILNSS